uniref:Abdominal-A n=1 Tax=Strongyloides papillosus TaxID=174720 RepID=A0A0N5BEX2_STREA
ALNLYFQHKFAGNGNNGGDDDAGAANASRVATDAVSVGHTATASVAGYGYVNRSSGVPVPPPHGYFPVGAEVPSQYPVLSPRYPASVVPSYEQSLKDDVTCLPA